MPNHMSHVAIPTFQFNLSHFREYRQMNNTTYTNQHYRNIKTHPYYLYIITTVIFVMDSIPYIASQQFPWIANRTLLYNS